MKDQNGIEIQVHDTVLVDEPTNPIEDGYNFGFAGQVVGFKDEFVQVVDGEGDVFDLDPSKLQIQD